MDCISIVFSVSIQLKHFRFIFLLIYFIIGIILYTVPVKEMIVVLNCRNINPL